MAIYTIIGEQVVLCEKKIHELLDKHQINSFDAISYDMRETTIQKEMSGVSLRSIQMYEQRNKDINKAQAESLYCLAKALGCTMEDLLED